MWPSVHQALFVTSLQRSLVLSPFAWGVNPLSVHLYHVPLWSGSQLRTCSGGGGSSRGVIFNKSTFPGLILPFRALE